MKQRVEHHDAVLGRVTSLRVVELRNYRRLVPVAIAFTRDQGPERLSLHSRRNGDSWAFEDRRRDVDKFNKGRRRFSGQHVPGLAQDQRHTDQHFVRTGATGDRPYP